MCCGPKHDWRNCVKGEAEGEGEGEDDGRRKPECGGRLILRDTLNGNDIILEQGIASYSSIRRVGHRPA